MNKIKVSGVILSDKDKYPDFEENAFLGKKIYLNNNKGKEVGYIEKVYWKDNKLIMDGTIFDNFIKKKLESNNLKVSILGEKTLFGIKVNFYDGDEIMLVKDYE